jgi:hypothetical protein
VPAGPRQQVAVDARLQAFHQPPALRAGPRRLPIEDQAGAVGRDDNEVVLGCQAIARQRRRQRQLGIVVARGVGGTRVEVVRPPALQVLVGDHVRQPRDGNPQNLLLHHPVEAASGLHAPLVLQHRLRLDRGPAHALDVAQVEAARAVDEVLQRRLAELEIIR